MKLRVFRLFERLQRIDDRLRLALQRQRPDPREVAMLRALKRSAKLRLATAR